MCASSSYKHIAKSICLFMALDMCLCKVGNNRKSIILGKWNIFCMQMAVCKKKETQILTLHLFGKILRGKVIGREMIHSFSHFVSPNQAEWTRCNWLEIFNKIKNHFLYLAFQKKEDKSNNSFILWSPLIKGWEKRFHIFL